MATDPVPIYGIAAGIAWVSLITVEFYEKIYRDRIERNREDLKRLGEDELGKLVSEIEARTRKDASFDSKALDSRTRAIRSLLQGGKYLTRHRKFVLYLLTVSSAVGMAASYSPTFQIASLPVGVQMLPITLTTVAYFLLTLVFLYGSWFLNEMFWFDEQILDISRARETIVAYRFSEVGLILVDWRKKIAYLRWDDRTTGALQKGRFKIVMMGDQRLEDFLRENGLAGLPRPPTEEELPP